MVRKSSSRLHHQKITDQKPELLAIELNESRILVAKTQSAFHRRAQRNAFHRGGRPQSRLFVTIGIRISLTNLTFELIPTTAAAARASVV